MAIRVKKKKDPYLDRWIIDFTSAELDDEDVTVKYKALISHGHGKAYVLVLSLDGILYCKEELEELRDLINAMLEYKKENKE